MDPDRPTSQEHPPGTPPSRSRWAGAPNPVPPPVTPRPQTLDDDLNFEGHLVPAEQPPRKRLPKRSVVIAGVVTATVLIGGGALAAEAFEEPEPRVTFTVTHVPEPSTTTQTSTETETETATRTVSPSSSSSSSSSRSTSR